MTFRHHHFKQSSLIEIGEVEEGKAGIGERKKKRTGRMSVPSDPRRLSQQNGTGSSAFLSSKETTCIPHLPKCVGSVRESWQMKKKIKLIRPKEESAVLSFLNEQKNV